MKTSSARRVHCVLKRAYEHEQTNGNTLQLWATVFGIADPKNNITPEVEDGVLSALRDLRDEVTEVERSVMNDAERVAGVAPIAQATRLLTASNVLYGDWNQTKSNHLRPEFLAGWHWAAITLPSEDDQISEEALASLSNELEQLENVAALEDVPDELRRLVRKQANSIRNAMRRYDIRGATPLRDAVSQATGELLREQDEIRSAVEKAPESGRQVFEHVRAVWNAAAKLCGDADKFHKGYLLVMDIYDKALPMLERLPTQLG